MGRHTGGRVLKRVDGDAYLAPLKLDQGRPITSGAPLRRCSNETQICLSPKEVSSIPAAPFRERNSTRETLERERNRIRTRSASSFKSKSSKDWVKKQSKNNESRRSTMLVPFTPSENYVVPTNTAVTSSTTKTYSKNTFTTGESASTHESERNPYIICINDDVDGPFSASTQSTNVCCKIDDYRRRVTSKSSQQQNSCSALLPITDSNFTSYTGGHSETEGTHTEEMLITTATSLDLPVGSRDLVSTRSDEWSLKNQVTTAALTKESSTALKTLWSPDSKTVLQSSVNSPSATETTYKEVGKAGDGDSINTPPGSEKVSEEDTFAIVLPVPPPPVTPASSPNKQPSFTLTFKKPKPRPRPRSIVTKSSSNKESHSLPTTASTPNPISPVSHGVPEVQNDGAVRDNTDTNNNIDNDVDRNNNEVVMDEANVKADCSEKIIKAKISKPVLSLKNSVVEGKMVFTTMPAEITHASTAHTTHTAHAVNAQMDATQAVDTTQTVDATQAVDTTQTVDNTHINKPEAETHTHTNEFEPDAAFWHSDSSPSIKTASDKDKVQHVTPKVHHAHGKGKQAGHTKPVNESKKGTKKPVDTSVTGTVTASEKGNDEEGEENEDDEDDEEEEEDTTTETSTSKSKYPDTSLSKSYGYPYSDYSYGGQQAEGPFLRTEKGAIRFHLPGRIQHKTTIKVAHFPTGDDKNVILNVKPDKEEDEACEEIPLPCGANNQNFVTPSYSYNPYGYGNVSPYSPANYYGYYGGYPSPYY